MSLKRGPRQQSGYFLMEALIALVVVGLIAMMLTRLFDQQNENLNVGRQGEWMAQYLNAVAGFMAQQGPVAPSFTVRNGTNWLKPSSCGGQFPADEAFLPCEFPTNFNNRFGLGAPRVTFNYTSSPAAAVRFGVVRQNPSNDRDPRMAGKLSQVINANLESAGYQHINAFHAADNSEITSANLRATINSQFAADQHLRIDGMNEMKATILSEHNEWAMITRNAGGNENAQPRNKRSSLNINDAFVRAAGDGDGYWASETHAIAEEALRLAARSIQGATEVISTGTVDAPECPAGYLAQIFVSQVALLGGTTAEPNLIAGFRRIVTRHPASGPISYWRIRIQSTEEEEAGWHNVGPNEARVLALTRCVPN